MSVTTRSNPRYDRLSIGLHWTTAAFVIVLWVIGQTADDIPDGPLNTAIWSVHVVGGFVLTLILISRIPWRIAGGARVPRAAPAAAGILAGAVHYLLYALLIVVALLGIANAFIRGYNLFDLGRLPQIGNPALKRPVTLWHGLAANILMAAALFHAAAALFHHYVWRDDVLRRMLPASRVRKG